MTLLPECLGDYVAEENPVRVVDIFVDEIDLGVLAKKSVPFLSLLEYFIADAIFL